MAAAFTSIPETSVAPRSMAVAIATAALSLSQQQKKKRKLGHSSSHRPIVTHCLLNLKFRVRPINKMKAVILPRRHRKEPRHYDRAPYKLRHLVENAFLYNNNGEQQIPDTPGAKPPSWLSAKSAPWRFGPDYFDGIRWNTCLVPASAACFKAWQVWPLTRRQPRILPLLPRQAGKARVK